MPEEIYHLRSHMIIHKRGPKYHCDLCGKSYNQKGEIRFHIMKHKQHKQDPN